MRSVVVTGASGGIGSAVCARLTADGWAVVATDRQPPKTCDDHACFVVGDLADRRLPQRLLAAVEQVGTPTGLVNNAAVAVDVPLFELDDDQLADSLDVNLGAPIRLTGVLGERLRRGVGAVVNVASVHALATSSGAAAYAAAKGGLVAFTRAAALELAPVGVRCNAVLPGAVDTGMLRAGLARAGDADGPDAVLARLEARTPLRRTARPREIASVVAWLLGPQAAFITGESVAVDGGALARLATE